MDSIQDASCKPFKIEYALTDLEKELAISLRKSSWVSIDEVWENLLEINAKISRRSIYRCFVTGKGISVQSHNCLILNAKKIRLTIDAPSHLLLKPMVCRTADAEERVSGLPPNGTIKSNTILKYKYADLPALEKGAGLMT